ncbi:MAG: histidine kinase [Pseudomonadota bacterium]
MKAGTPFHPVGRSYLYTSLFCLAVALVTWINSWNTSLLQSLLVSFSIGLSINTCFLMLSERLQPLFGPYITPIPVTALGLAIGLVIGGTLVAGRPLLFFTSNYWTLVSGVFLGIIGFLVIGTRARLLETEAALAQAEAERERQERLISDQSLKVLQAQIEPHFLFNTLTNIAALIRTDAVAAEAMLENLTTLLRSSLDRTRESETTLAQELTIVDAYLSIHATRMQDRLRYQIDHDKSLDDMALPPLTIQPLVENAVKYAIDPREEGGHIHISTQRTADGVEIAVADDGPGIDPASSPTGTGIRNVRERIRMLLTGATLKIEQIPSGGLRAVIHVPQDGPE